MIRAANATKDGGHLILLGVTPANLRRLKDGQPIYVDCTPLGKPGLKLTIMFGQTERAITAELRSHGIELPDDAEQGLRDVEREHREKGTAAEGQRSITGRDVATRMRAIEDNITGETGLDAPALDRVAATLLDIDFDGLDTVLDDEGKRVLALLNDWYRKHGIEPSTANAVGLALVQGITFAVAARRAHDDANAR